MNRMQKINYINEKVLPYAEISNSHWLLHGREVVAEMVNAISAWRIGKPADIEMYAKVVDGVFCINGEPVKRVAPKLPKLCVDDLASYYEGKILAAQEIY